MSKQARYLSFSVDDGHPTDLRAAELLARHGLKATFYIPKRNPEREVMTDTQIREIASHFDIGGHTLNHLPLNRMDDARALGEIRGGKHWLEQLSGRALRAFCYPRGKVNRRTPELVRQAGFLGGRTCECNLNDFPANPYRWGLSTHAHSHSPWIQFQHAFVEGNLRGAYRYLTRFRMATDWTEHFLRALEDVEVNGGIAHLYFHSWEIDMDGDWGRLDQVLGVASRRKGNFQLVDNSELFESWRHREGRPG